MYLQQLSTGEFLTIAGIIVAAGIGLATIIGTVLATRRWGNGRRKLLFEYQSTALIPDASSRSTSLLKVTFRDVAVEDPHLLIVRLKNIGPADSSSAPFGK